MQLLIATRNRDKLKEIEAILAELNLEIRSAADVAGPAEVKEDGASIRDYIPESESATQRYQPDRHRS